MGEVFLFLFVRLFCFGFWPLAFCFLVFFCFVVRGTPPVEPPAPPGEIARCMDVSLKHGVQ